MDQEDRYFQCGGPEGLCQRCRERKKTMDDRERATVLAALRHWQRTAHDLNHFTTVAELTNNEIDELCERINTGDDERWRNEVNNLLDDLAGGGYDESDMIPTSLVELVERAADLGARKRS